MSEPTAAQLGIAMARGSLSCSQESWLQYQICSTLAEDFHGELTLYLVTASVWSKRDSDHSRDRGCLYTAVQEQSQNQTWMPKACWDNWCYPAVLPGGNPWAHLAFSSRPDWFSSQAWLICSMANPSWSLLQPHIVYLFLYSYIIWHMSGNKTAGLLPRRAPVLCQR